MKKINYRLYILNELLKKDQFYQDEKYTQIKNLYELFANKPECYNEFIELFKSDPFTSLKDKIRSMKDKFLENMR